MGQRDLTGFSERAPVDDQWSDKRRTQGEKAAGYLEPESESRCFCWAGAWGHGRLGRHEEDSGAKGLRRSLQRDDRQMSSASVVVDVKLEPDSRLAPDEGLRSGAP